ncbi:hypothetical protein LRP88_12640 [Fusarium phalaenopsidis]
MDGSRREEELKELLQKAEQRAEEAEKGREKERQRAEEAERERQKERQRAEASEQQTQPTILNEYIAACHSLRITFGTLYDTFSTDSRLFENRSFLAGLGNRISKRKIADEKALKYFLHNSVEDPVKTIMDQLKEVEEVRSAFHLGNGIIFENYPHALSDMAEEVIDRETLSTPPSTPDHRLDLN